jgi:ABC-2 type transport system ATP-binding protein
MTSVRLVPSGHPLPKSISPSTDDGVGMASWPTHRRSCGAIVEDVTKTANEGTTAPHGGTEPTPAGATAIEVVGLAKHYGAAVAVDDLSFSVSYGRIVGFLGPNGAGKTTTLRTLLGLVSPTSGSATIDGHSYTDLPEPARTVGALLDGGALHPGRSGRNHLRALAVAAGISMHRVEELLSLVGLESAADRRAGAYSLGMRQRLGLAVALLGDPKVLVLDEPANGLDPEGIRWLRDLLTSLAAEGRAVLVSSHALAEVSQTVDDVVVIRHGRSVLQAPLEKLLAKHAASVHITGPDVGLLAEVLMAEGAHVVPYGPEIIVVHDRSEAEVLHAVSRHRFVVDKVSSVGPTLEKVYLELIGDPNGGPLCIV